MIYLSARGSGSPRSGLGGLGRWGDQRFRGWLGMVVDGYSLNVTSSSSCKWTVRRAAAYAKFRKGFSMQ